MAHLSGGDGAESESESDAAAVGETLLLGTTGGFGSIESESAVQSSPSRRWLLLGIAAAGVLMWGLFSWPGAEGETAVGRDVSEQDDDGSKSEDDESDADGDTTTTRRRATTTTRGQTTADGVSVGVTEEPPDPWLVVGEPTGIGVLVGTFNSAGSIELLEVDTGRRHELAGLNGTPVAMIDSTVVTWSGPRMFTLDLSKPDQQPVRLQTDTIAGSGSWVEFVGVEDDKIWTSIYSDAADMQRLVAFAPDGEVVEELEIDQYSIWWSQGSSSDFVSTRVGGIYRRVGDRYQQLSAGRLLAVGEDLVLLDECDERLNCGSRWVDNDTWETVDHPAVDGSDWSGAYAILGGDRFLARTDWRSEEMIITEIASARVVRVMVLNVEGPGQGRVPMSDDGRWLADLSVRDAPVIVSLDSDAEWPMPSMGRRGSDALIVDLSETVFASPVWDDGPLCSAETGEVAQPSADGPPAGLTRC